MSKVTRTSIIIYDDYNNVLIVKKGKNRNTASHIWSLVSKELKGRETEEKCITKAVDHDLSCTIFNLTPFKEYKVGEEEKTLVYTGFIRETVISHKTIESVKWIGKREIDKYDFSPEEKQILSDFFLEK